MTEQNTETSVLNILEEISKNSTDDNFVFIPTTHFKDTIEGNNDGTEFLIKKFSKTKNSLLEWWKQTAEGFLEQLEKLKTNNLAFYFIDKNEIRYDFLFTEDKIIMKYNSNSTPKIVEIPYNDEICHFIIDKFRANYSNIFKRNENGLSIANTILKNTDNLLLNNSFIDYIHENVSKINIKSKNIEFVKALYEAGKDITIFKNYIYAQEYSEENLESILDSVIIGGNTEIIEKLVSTYKIDLNMLLEKACAGNKFEIFKYLVDKLSKEKSLIFEREQINNFFSNIKNPKIALYFIEEIPRILNIKVDINAIFFYAVINEYTEIVQLLLLQYKNKININIIKDSKGLTPLHYAAAKGNIEIFNLLLSQPNVEINVKNEKEYTPLHFAAANGHIEIVNLLLSKPNIEINAKNNYNLTPLHFAAANGHIEIVNLLLSQQNIKINDKDFKRKYTPLYYAAFYGHVEIFNLLLSKIGLENVKEDYKLLPYKAILNGGKEIVQALITHIEKANEDISDYSELFYLAVENNCTDVVEFLLSCNILKEKEINIDNFPGHPIPLVYAAEHGYKEMVELLLKQKDIDVNKRAVYGNYTPLYLAVENGHMEIVDILLSQPNIDIYLEPEYSSSNTIFHLAVENKDIKLVQKLLEKQDIIDINAEGEYKNTALHLAIQKEDTEMVRLLLSQENININITNSYGDTPFSLAIQKGNIEIVKEFFKKVTNINAKIRYEDTPIYIAVENGHMEIVQELLEKYEIDADAKNISLYAAAENGYLEIVQELLKQQDININAKNNYYEKTPLHIAAEKGKIEVVQELLKQPTIEINAKDKDGNTPLHLAVQNRHIEIVQEIIKLQNIKINEKNNNGHTPFYLAVKNIIPIDMVELLFSHKDLIIEEDAELKNEIEKISKCYRGIKEKITEYILHIAVANRHTEKVKKLLERPNIDINAKDNYGNTPIYIAARNGYAEIVQELLKKPNVDINTKNGTIFKETPLDVAVRKKNIEVVQLLLLQPNIKIRDESLIINLIGREEFDKYTEKRNLIVAKSKAEEERLQQLKMRIPKPENTINLNSAIYAMDQQNTKNKYSMEIDKK